MPEHRRSLLSPYPCRRSSPFVVCVLKRPRVLAPAGKRLKPTEPHKIGSIRVKTPEPWWVRQCLLHHEAVPWQYSGSSPLRSYPVKQSNPGTQDACESPSKISTPGEYTNYGLLVVCSTICLYHAAFIEPAALWQACQNRSGVGCLAVINLVQLLFVEIAPLIKALPRATLLVHVSISNGLSHCAGR